MENTLRFAKEYRYIIILSLFTIIYNLLEGLISTYFGFEDETLSLFGFGIDSFIEMISGFGILQMIYRIKANPNSPQSDFEKTALQITGWCFYALVVVILVGAGISIYEGHEPENTLAGVIIASISIGFMWWLIREKVRIGKILNSNAIIADANCARVCLYMSLVLLGASLIDYLIGIKYIDALGALGIAWFSYKEGKEALEKSKGIHHCECHHH